MHLVDTHQHLWDTRRFPYSWCAGIPALNRSFLIRDYLAAAEGAGIAKTVFMECDVDEPHALDEARHIQELSEEYPLIAGIVAGARPERADFPRQLDALLDLPKLRGIRRVLHVAPDTTSQSEMFAENVRSLGPHGLTFDLCVLARQLPLAISLVEKCPGVRFVLDHCGNPDVKAGVSEPWLTNIRRMAGFPNVVCKISGLVVHAGQGWSVDYLRPWVDHVVASFGWDRVLWGGDWPVCTLVATLKQWVAATEALFASATEADRTGCFSANAERIYRV